MGSGTYLDNAGHTIQNNKIKDFYLYGIYLANADTILIANNDINRATRATVTTLGGIYLNSSRNLKIQSNRLHDFGIASYTAYPIQIVGCVNTAGFETEISNNLIYNVGTTAIMHGITFLTTASSGFNIYHNTIQHEVPSTSTAVARGVNFGVAVTSINFKNNIIGIKGAGTGVKTGIYVTTTSPSIISNNNVIHVNTSASNNVGYWTATRATLLDWQTASTQDAASVSSDPVFANASIGNLYPISSNCDNIGTPLAAVTTDFMGVVRSGTPDPGALEFTGIAGDIAMIKGELKRSSDCYSTNDTLRITIKNLIGPTADFSMNPLKIVWKTTGPVITRDSFMLSSGTLNPDSSLTLLATNVNMSKAGTYTLDAYVAPNAINVNSFNDTLVSMNFTVKSILEVTPKTITITGAADTVVLLAKSTLFPGGGAFFSEIAHFKTTTGQPTTGWPTYLLSDDYVELTGVPNSDLAGYVLEEWSGTAIQHTVTFPTGTLFSPSGTMVLATGQLGSSVPVPASFYYHTGNTATHGSTGISGYVLKNSIGTIIDAVSYGAYSFPVASGVTVTDWSGSTTNANSGIRLNAPDNNTSSTWINSSVSPQDPNALNSGVTAPAPIGLTGFNWNYLGSSFSTSPKVTVGPYTTFGVYTYVASYTNTCGTFYDTARVTYSAPVPVKLVSFTAAKSNADVNLVWNTANETNNSHFEIERSLNGTDFNAIGRVKGMGTINRPSRYTFVDEKAVNTSSRALYYRLKQVDNDGAAIYSRTEVVTVSNKQLSGLGTHPNPSNGRFTISTELTSTSAVNMKVVNIMGATVWNQTVNPKMGVNSFDTQLQLPDGVYMLLFEQNGETSTQKFVIEK
ncbi:MAG: T9SS type A sorting domain-containing protein [Bacteroidota bacterium]